MKYWVWINSDECVTAHNQYEAWNELCKNNPRCEVLFEDIMEEDEAHEYLEGVAAARQMMIKVNT